MQPQNPRPVWLFAALFCLIFGVASAQRRDATAGIAPPQPVPLSVKVQRQGKTEIPLRIYGLAGEALKFLVRTPPTHGRTSEPRAIGRETAATIYEPPADLAITSDRFFYAAQSAAGVSASVEVAITILDQPPQLTIPDTLDFAAVRTAATATKLLEIANSGGGLATGEVIVEAPWRIDGKASYRLAAGDIAVFKIHFSPVAGGAFENVARFTSDPAHSTTLRGVGEALVAVNPTPLLLRHAPGDPVRRGTCEISNQTDAALTLQLAPHDRLQLPAQLALAAREHATIEVQAKPGNVLAIDSEIVFTAPDFEIRLPVKAAPASAIVRPVFPVVMFGRVPADRVSNARLEFENIGGLPGEVTWTIAAPFRTAQSSTLLQPGEKRAVLIELESRKNGRVRTLLQYQFAGHNFELPVEAEVADIATLEVPRTVVGRMRTVSDSGPADEGENALEGTATPSSKGVVPPEWFGDAVTTPGVNVTKVTPTTATFEWPASLSTATRFRLEYRQFFFAAERRLDVKWIELPDQAVESRGSVYTTTIRELEPAQPWVFRVLPIKPDGTAGERLFSVKCQTPPQGSLLGEVSPLRVLLVALAALVAWQLAGRWRRRKIA